MSVKEELFKCHIATDELCACCVVEVESISHVLFECDIAREELEQVCYVHCTCSDG